MDGRLYEVINVTTELISFRDAQGVRALFLTPEDLKSLLFKKQILLAEAAPIAVSNAALFLNSSDPHVIAAKRKHHYVIGIRNAFLGSMPRRACEKELTKLAKEIGDSKPPSYVTVWNWTSACKKANWAPWALLKRKSILPRGKKTPQDAREIVLRYIKESYLTDQRVTVSYVHLLIKGQIIEDNIARKATNSKTITIPSLSTVRREINRLCHFYKDTYREGVKTAQQLHKFGPQWTLPPFLLDQCEIDCKTPLPIILVDDQGELLGKISHLQAIIEIISGKVIGYDLSFTPPCAEKTLRTLRMALQAIPGEELERGKMITLIGDRGSENNNKTIINVTNALGVKFVLPPPETPDARPHIERFFRTADGFFNSLPGTTFANPGACGRYDSASHACLTLEQLQALFKEWLEGQYHNTPQGQLSPNAKWTKAMTHQLPPTKYSKEDLDSVLRAVEHRSISNGIVCFNHLQWSSPSLNEIERNLKKSQKAIIYYDITDLAQVWVAHPEAPNDMIPAMARNRDYQKGLTLYEHNLVLKTLADEGKSFSNDLACITALTIHRKVSQVKKDFEAKRHKQGKNVKNSKVGNEDPSNTLQDNYETRQLGDNPLEGVHIPGIQGEPNTNA